MDLIHLLRKLKEVDRLKEILLSEEEKLCFDFAPKLAIHEKNDKHLNQSRSSVELFRKYHLKREQGTVEEIKDYEKLYKGYIKIIRKEEQSLVQKRLTEKLDGELLKIFKEEISKEANSSSPNEEKEDNKIKDRSFLVLPDTTKKMIRISFT